MKMMMRKREKLEGRKEGVGEVRRKVKT